MSSQSHGSSRLGRFSAFALALAIGATSLAYISAKAGAASALKGPPAAPVIATVDLEGVVSALNERKDKEAEFNKTREDLLKRVNTLKDDVAAEKSKFEQAADPNEKLAIAKAHREKGFRFEFETQYSEKLLAEMQAEMLRALYLKIDAAAEAIAKQQGYQLVLASDEKANIPQGSPDAVNRGIALKRMLYVDPSLDITREIVDRMNNDYATKK